MMKKSKSFRSHKKKLIFRGGSSKLSFASFVQEGSSIMGGSSNIGGSSNVSGALKQRNQTLPLFFSRYARYSSVSCLAKSLYHLQHVLTIVLYNKKV
jgi:hypothetical protein